MVGQDFLFACAAYPEEEPFAAEVAAEARENVIRLSSHPSLVMWTGNNENIWGHEDWGWKEPLGDRTWGAGYYFELLPRIVSEAGPVPAVLAGQPVVRLGAVAPQRSRRTARCTSGTCGTPTTTRSTGRTGRGSWPSSASRRPPAYATLRRAISDEPLAHDSPGMAHHQKAIDGDLKLQRGLDDHLPAPRDFDDWHYLTQLNQARALAFGIEHFRSLRPHCMGTIMWQLNDCWPVTSWAAVDGDGRRKPLWYALRRVFADRLLTIQPRDGGLALIAVNDGREPWDLAGTVVPAQPGRGVPGGRLGDRDGPGRGRR